MRQAVATFALFAFILLPPAARANPAPDFWTLARNAIADPATLSTVHSLYQLVSVRPLGSAGNMPMSFELSMRNRTSLIASWIAPPSRYLVRTGPYETGIDGDRFIGQEPADHSEPWNRLRHWALALLRCDPAAVGVTITDRGSSLVGKRQLHVLDATADGFAMRMYFDPRSYRLVMSEDLNEATPFSTPGAPPFGGMPPPSPAPIQGSTQSVGERETYGSYRRVQGIELPFSIIRSRQGAGRAGATTTGSLEVVKYVVNPSDLDQQFHR